MGSAGQRPFPSRSKRLIVDPSWIADGQATLRGDVLHHVRRVMRLRPGAALVLADGAGRAYEGTLETLEGGEARVAIHAVRELAPEPEPRLTLVHGLARGARTEWVLQKGTELGVGRFLPAICQRSVARPKQLEQKRARWQEIVRQAARQCGRAWLPELAPARPLDQALAAAASAEVRVAATIGAERPAGELAPAMASAREVALAVGPEGGFTAEEVAQTRAAGFEAISLGPLVLRTETAALALVAITAQLAGKL